MSHREEERRRKVIVSAAVLGLIALAVYFGFIFLAGKA